MLRWSWAAQESANLRELIEIIFVYQLQLLQVDGVKDISRDYLTWYFASSLAKSNTELEHVLRLCPVELIQNRFNHACRQALLDGPWVHDKGQKNLCELADGH